MANLILSGKHSTIEEIYSYYQISEDSLNMYFTQNNNKLTGYSLYEIQQAKLDNINILDRNIVFEILAFLEAILRVDYHHRIKNRKKDPLSRSFQEIHKQKGNKVSLIGDILKKHREHNQENKKIIDAFQRALDYRNWLAHGRYWKSEKTNNNYDFLSTMMLANTLINNINLYA